MISSSFELSIEVGGKRIPEYGHKGKTYVEGRRDNAYHIKVRNSGPSRVLVVPSVDGLSTIDGQPATFNSNGYVVQGYSSVTIRGWRTSLNESHSFKFKSKDGSYAGKTEGAQNCGLIGVLVFGEKVVPPVVQRIIKEIHHHYPRDIYWSYPAPPIPDYICTVDSTGGLTGSQTVYGHYTAGSSPEAQLSCNSAAPIPAVNSILASMVHDSAATQPVSAPAFNLGTGWGEAQDDTVTEVKFERDGVLATLEIYYSDREGLVKDGIQLDKAPELAVFPKAFGGFCKAPA